MIAEGIETEEQAAVSRAIGADLGEGWLFGHPVLAAELEAAVPPASTIDRTSVTLA